MTIENPVVIAGGGTGGHVYPGLALARELTRRRPSRPVMWIGARGGIEERIVSESGIPLTLLPLAGIAHRGFGRGARAAWLALVATLRLIPRFARSRPAIAIGVGGFASGPAILAALLLGVPTLLLEQNSIPGRTNRGLSRLAGAVAISFAETESMLGGRAILTGNPVREEIAQIPEWNEGPLRSILSFGGSRGAQALNDAWIDAAPRVLDLGLSITLVSGASDFERVQEALSGTATKVMAYAEELPALISSADLVVARAGATTVAELTASGRASILIPYPFAADDHQRANARSLQRAGAAVVIDPGELSAESLGSAVRALAGARTRLADMSRAARLLGRRDAARRAADLAEQLIGDIP